MCDRTALVWALPHRSRVRNNKRASRVEATTLKGEFARLWLMRSLPTRPLSPIPSLAMPHRLFCKHLAPTNGCFTLRITFADVFESNSCENETPCFTACSTHAANKSRWCFICEVFSLECELENSDGEYSLLVILTIFTTHVFLCTYL